MPALPVVKATPNDIKLRHAEALTGIDYKDIYDAAMAGHIRHRRVDGPYSFRVHRPDVLAWAATQPPRGERS
jgi:hypothetical protein|nr:MAG TPA: excisionase [Caudoviricetes sp.]